jgi:hypothetical protein
MAKLTYQQKLDALSYRFYQGAQWSPKAGDFYTTSRADLELYQVVSVEDGIVRTRFTEGSEAIAEWPEPEFLTGGFGPKRVFVPEWVYPTPAPNEELIRDLVKALESAKELATVAEGMTSCQADDDFVWGIQAKINDALTRAALSATATEGK